MPGQTWPGGNAFCYIGKAILSFPQQTLHSTFTLMPQGLLVAERTAQSCCYGSNYHGLSHGLQLA